MICFFFPGVSEEINSSLSSFDAMSKDMDYLWASRCNTPLALQRAAGFSGIHILHASAGLLPELLLLPENRTKMLFTHMLVALVFSDSDW